MSTTRQITLAVPTDIDIAQKNYVGLIINEINKARVEMQTKITEAYDEIYDHVAGPTGTMNNALDTAESNINNTINTELATVDGSGNITTEGAFVTEMKNYVDDRLADFEKHVTESLATKANLKTTDALDEFFKVVGSAMTFSGTGASYNPPV